MKQQITYNKIQLDDLPTIIQIEQQIYPNPWPVALMQDCLHAGYQCIKGELKNQPGEIVCYAFLLIGFEEANLLNISVNPKFQRQSIASQLMHRLLLICRINHAKHLWLEVRASNEPAINLYRQFEFKEIGKRKNYYQYTNAKGERIKEHAILMSKPVK